MRQLFLLREEGLVFKKNLGANRKYKMAAIFQFFAVSFCRTVRTEAMRRPVTASRKSLEYQLVRNQQRGLGRFYTSFGGKDSPGPTAWLSPALTSKNWLLRESQWCLRILSPDCPVKKAMRKMRQKALYIPCMHGKMSLHSRNMWYTISIYRL